MTEGEFFRVKEPGEACELLARFGVKGKIIAGGTDLMVDINQREVSPEALIYIGESGLDYIRADGDHVVIGATTAFADIGRSTLVRGKTPLLAEVVSHIGSPAIRNVGTIGGNLASASPAADSATALLGLGASVKLISRKKERTVRCDAFFTGPNETVLGADEIIQEVIVPVQPEGSQWAYRKLGKRKAQSLSVVSVAVFCQKNGGKPGGLRIALGAVAPTPILAEQAGKVLEGKAVDTDLIDQAAKTASGETSPIDDVRSSAWYRRRAVEALTKQLLGQIFA